MHEWDGYKLLDCSRRLVEGDPITGADAELIKRAADHALLWWAIVYGPGWMLGGLRIGSKIVNSKTGEAFTIAGRDDFGFPILSGELRQRLYADMRAAFEATKTLPTEKMT